MCQEILSTLLDLPTLVVLDVHSQHLLKSLHREVTLDAFCVLEDGSYANIEMQKANCNDDIARTRFHAGLLTTQYTPKGTEFQDIPKVTILYITEYDALNSNQTVTHVTRCMKVGDNYIPVNDGEDIIFANTLIDDGSDKSKLLQLMLNKEAFYNAKFPAISNAVKYFKDTEGGQSEMCKSVELYAHNYAVEYAKESRAQDIQKMLLNGKTSKQIADFCGYDLSEVEEVERSLLAATK